MSALTPDEEAELAGLTRALFSPGAAPDAAAQARFAALDQRRRAAAQLPAEAPEPALAPSAMVPEPPGQVSEKATEPTAVHDGAPETGAQVFELAPPKPERETRSKRTKILSAVAGFAIAAVVTLAVQWGTTPSPVASGTAAEISAEDLPNMGEQHGVAITGCLPTAPMRSCFASMEFPGYRQLSWKTVKAQRVLNDKRLEVWPIGSGLPMP
ncbi:hypothetical protein ACQUSY_12870 [Microbacterium sp. YY-03]|uniref:hypothetical protein n=1 Tax=Microbacterium sp. YY-03 TaxID=3421636 RepID=UPI003D181A61